MDKLELIGSMGSYYLNLHPAAPDTAAQRALCAGGTGPGSGKFKRNRKKNKHEKKQGRRYNRDYPGLSDRTSASNSSGFAFFVFSFGFSASHYQLRLLLFFLLSL